MKQTFTFSALLLLLLCGTSRVNAQLLYSYSFDTSVSLSYGTTVSGWADSSYGYYCCSSTQANWEFGSYSSAPGSHTTFPSYAAGPGGISSYYVPAPLTHSGSGLASFNSFYTYGSAYSSGRDIAELSSPAVSLPSTGQSTVSYWIYLDEGLYGGYYGYGSSYQGDSVSVYVNNAPRVKGGTFLRRVKIDSSSSIVSGWYQYVDTLPTSYNGTNVNIIFKASPTYYLEGADVNLDDVALNHYYQCAGMPTAGSLKGPTHICAGTTFSITDTALAKYVGFSFQWQKRNTGTTIWSNIGGSVNPLVTSISTSTDFRVYATCLASSQTDTSNSFTVTTDTFYKCYCALPTTNTVIGGSTPPTIDSVSISSTTLHNATHTALPGNYIQFPDTGATVPTLTVGGTYTLYVKYAGATSYGMAWIDYNHSQSFNDSTSEYLAVNTGLLSAGSIAFTVPSTARLGKTGLRIRNSNSSGASSSYSCYNMGTGYGAGETEDYIINIAPQPGHDLGATVVIAPAAGATFCAGAVDTITARVLNFGRNSESNFKIIADYSGPSSGSINTVYTGTLAPLASAVVYIGTITPPTGGAYNLRVYTILSTDSTNLDDTVTSSFKLNPLPNRPIVNSDTVCPGYSATISITPSGTNKYKWYSAPTGGTPVFNGTTSFSQTNPTHDTVFYVTSTDSTTGCEGSRLPIAIAVRNPPAVNLGPDATMCENPTYLLHAGVANATYQWNTGDTTEAIHVKTTGTYSVNVYKYCSAADTINLIINPLPQGSGIDYVRAGNTYGFTVAGVANTTSYFWKFSDGDTSTQANPIHTFKTPATSVTVILMNTCGNDTLTWALPTGIYNTGKDNTISMYPNPASSTITISGDKSIEIKDVIVVNSVGATVYKGSVNSKTGVIDVSSFPSGSYILRATTSLGIVNKLFEVLH
ncbi:MAG: T9SS type A sorting domain-containing protein [Taibaiella sp.]|nr:T9SS type A sorting domain-containing protein [Taibaiella sp.]